MTSSAALFLQNPWTPSVVAVADSASAALENSFANGIHANHQAMNAWTSQRTSQLIESYKKEESDVSPRTEEPDIEPSSDISDIDEEEEIAQPRSLSPADRKIQEMADRYMEQFDFRISRK